MSHRVTVVNGDGVGPEVIAGACRVLEAAVPSMEWDVQPLGAEAVARNENSDQIVRLPASSKPREVTFSTHLEPEAKVGIWISVLSLAIAAIALIWGLAGLDRSRFRRRPSA